jgi:hypothetical protein
MNSGALARLTYALGISPRLAWPGEDRVREEYPCHR